MKFSVFADIFLEVIVYSEDNLVYLLDAEGILCDI
jgi:hypothetical protein